MKNVLITGLVCAGVGLMKKKLKRELSNDDDNEASNNKKPNFITSVIDSMKEHIDETITDMIGSVPLSYLEMVVSELQDHTWGVDPYADVRLVTSVSSYVGYIHNELPQHPLESYCETFHTSLLSRHSPTKWLFGYTPEKPSMKQSCMGLIQLSTFGSNERCAFIGCRNTQTIEDWKRNLQIKNATSLVDVLVETYKRMKSDEKLVETKTFFHNQFPIGSVHSGYYDVVFETDEESPSMFEQIKNFLREHNVKKVIVGGHSMGGCLAVMIGVALCVHSYDVKHVFTVNSPYAYDDSFSSVFRKGVVYHCQIKEDFVSGSWIRKQFNCTSPSLMSTVVEQPFHKLVHSNNVPAISLETKHPIWSHVVSSVPIALFKTTSLYRSILSLVNDIKTIPSSHDNHQLLDMCDHVTSMLLQSKTPQYMLLKTAFELMSLPYKAHCSQYFIYLHHRPVWVDTLRESVQVNTIYRDLPIIEEIEDTEKEKSFDSFDVIKSEHEVGLDSQQL